MKKLKPYDSYARLTKVQRYPTSGTEDTCQQVNYTYDTDSTGYSNSMTLPGHVASIQYMGGNNPNLYPSPTCDTTFTELYNYAASGGTVGKRLNFQRTVKPFSDSSSTTTESINLDATFTYDNEGRMTGEQFPSWVDGSGTTNPGPNLAYTFDSMGRPSTLTEENASVDVITGAGYGPANEMTSMSGSWGSEERTYNSLKQLTGIFSTGVYATYAYPTTQNNGKISSQYDGVTGETVTYAFDTLNRLITATSSVSSQTQGFSYDGFGNLDAASGANAFSTSYNQSTNQALACTDANGNSASTSMAGTTGCSGAYLNTYDVTNRIVATWEGMYYSYAPGSKRVWRGSWTGSGETGYTPATDEITFWSMRGSKMASYQITLVQGCCEGTAVGSSNTSNSGRRESASSSASFVRMPFDRALTFLSGGSSYCRNKRRSALGCQSS